MKIFYILIDISLKFAPKCAIVNKSSLVQVMDWCWLGNKPFPEEMMNKMYINFKWNCATMS